MLQILNQPIVLTCPSHDLMEEMQRNEDEIIRMQEKEEEKEEEKKKHVEEGTPTRRVTSGHFSGWPSVMGSGNTDNGGSCDHGEAPGGHFRFTSKSMPSEADLGRKEPRKKKKKRQATLTCSIAVMHRSTIYPLTAAEHQPPTQTEKII